MRAPLGEHLLRGLGQRTLGVAEDGLCTAGDEGTAGDGGSGTSERPGRVGARVLHLRGGRAPRLAGPAMECWRRQASG